MGPIAERIAAVRARIACAARAAGRDVGTITLLGAAKRKPAEAVREAYAAGLRDFGENYVQELLAKREALADLPGLRLHMIGHLQRNKARHVVRAAAVVQTVSSAGLARELGRRAAEWTAPEDGDMPPQANDIGGPLAVLVEVNVGREAQKSGCVPEELEEVLEAVDREHALALRGLMMLPPHTEDPAGARPYFDELVRLRDGHGESSRLPELSMGMTHDLEHAIAAGATIVRVGTAIFGPR